jgi:hypothetical protein
MKTGKLPPYRCQIRAGDVVGPAEGGTFGQAPHRPETATVTGVGVYICPMEGPEWLVTTTAGQYFSHALMVIRSDQ